MSATTVLGGLAIVLLLPLLVAAVRQRSLVTMARRNIARRRSEAVLIVGGALLGTAIITSAFVVGDVIEASLADAARTGYGPIDLVVTAADDATLDELTAVVAGADAEGVEAVLPATLATATLEAPGRDAAAPRAQVLEVDLGAARGFGADPDITGLTAAGSLRPGEVLLNTAVGDRLGVGVGDTVRLHAYGAAIDATVAAVIDEVGLAGYGDAIAAPGTVATLAGERAEATAPPRRQVLVSLDGGVHDTRAVSDAAETDLRAAVAALPGTEVSAVKAAVLDDARRDGAGFTQLFATVGAFSVLAGVLLLVNLFVMLAEERRSELGMLRAIGFTRRRLVRAFAIEGAAYAVVAAALGAVAGVGVGWVVAVLAAGVFDPAGSAATAPLVVELGSLATGASVGLVVSLVTIWVTSQRIARLNVIQAIRDLPDVAQRRGGARALVLGGSGVALGAGAGVAGYLAAAPIALLLGVPLAAFGAAPLLRRVLPDRAVRLMVASTVLGWGLAVVPLFPAIMSGLDEAVFVLQGVVLTAGAVSLATSMDRLWTVVIERLGRGGGRGLAARLGVIYPLARRLRTSLLLAMFALTIFTVTIISSVAGTFERTSDGAAAAAAGGFDLLVDSDPGDAIPLEALAARGDVAAVAGLARGTARFAADGIDGARTAPITGFDADLLAQGTPALFQRGPSHATDADAYRAVLEDPTLAIVPDGFLVGDTGTAVLTVGDRFTVIEPDTGRPRELTVAAVGEADAFGNGALVGRSLTAALLGDHDVAARAYVTVAPDADADAVAASLDARYLEQGAEAVTFAARWAEGTRQLLGFMALVQGFLGLGLLVGIAGLAVVMIRAVRERRQEIGMLRAMGLRRGLVRAALSFEAGLVAVQGTVIGAVLGLATARQLVRGTEAFGDGSMPFVVPWADLVLIVGLPLAAALLATAWPASRAAATRPAVALRTAG